MLKLKLTFFLVFFLFYKSIIDSVSAYKSQRESSHSKDGRHVVNFNAGNSSSRLENGTINGNKHITESIKDESKRESKNNLQGFLHNASNVEGKSWNESSGDSEMTQTVTSTQAESIDVKRPYETSGEKLLEAQRNLKTKARAMVSLIEQQLNDKEPPHTFPKLEEYLKANQYEELRNFCELHSITEFDEGVEEQERITGLAKILKMPVNDFISNIRQVIHAEYPSARDIEESFVERSLCYPDDIFFANKLGYTGQIDKNDLPSEIAQKIDAALHLAAINEMPLVKASNIDSKSNANCNDESCKPRDDPNSCLSRIPIVFQDCGVCWIYTVMAQLELLRCVKYKLAPVKLSERYLRRCWGQQVCSGGSHYQFVTYLTKHKKIIKSGMFSVEQARSNYKNCSYPAGTKNYMEGWRLNGDDQTAHIRQFIPTWGLGYKTYLVKEYVDCGKIGVLYDIVKKTIREKGSIAASMLMQGQIGNSPRFFPRDHVVKRCNGEQSNHIMAVIGYGTYIDSSGRRNQYIEIRNSWGTGWGNQGYFKLDFYGPSGCNGQVASQYVDLLMEPENLQALGEDFDYCKGSNPCMNEGVCHYNSKTDSTYRCVCKAPYSGKDCEQYEAADESICSPPNICKNGGTCNVIGPSEYACDCLPSWKGKNCEIENFCYPDPCPKEEKCIDIKDANEGEKRKITNGKNFCREFTKIEKEKGEHIIKLEALKNDAKSKGLFAGGGILIACILAGSGYYVYRSRKNVESSYDIVDDEDAIEESSPNKATGGFFGNLGEKTKATMAKAKKGINKMRKTNKEGEEEYEYEYDYVYE